MELTNSVFLNRNAGSMVNFLLGRILLNSNLNPNTSCKPCMFQNEVVKINLRTYLLSRSCKTACLSFSLFILIFLIGDVGLKFVGTGSMVIILITQGKPVM